MKNKKEIWKAEARIKVMREKAKSLLSASQEEQQAFFDKLKKIGLNIDSIADVLSLNKNDYLNRRLQTVLVAKNLASTSRGARQLITHRKVLVDGRVVDAPSYVVSVEMEGKIALKIKPKRTPKVEEKPQETPAGEAPEKDEKPLETEEKVSEGKNGN